MIFFGKLDKEAMQKNKAKLYIIGTLMMIGGVCAISMPLVAAWAIETVIGILLLITGLGLAAGAFRASKAGERTWHKALFSVLSLGTGAFMLCNPLEGMFTLGVVMGTFFMVDGVTKVVEYFRLKELKGSIWMLVTGVINILLAMMVFSNFITSISIMGIILGVDLVMASLALFVLASNCN